MADPMTPERLAEIRAREQAATPGPWEPGNVWLIAGLIYDDDGNRVDPESATRCGFCHLGEPAWSGRRSINGPIMNAHRHRNPEPWSVENLISAANGDLVAGNFDYEEGGIIAPADTAFVAAARQDVPALLDEVERLREQVAVVEKFCAERAEYITAINNCNPDNAHDYHRWQGHAEGRRQLSEQLGLPVAWPAGYEQRGTIRALDGTEPGR